MTSQHYKVPVQISYCDLCRTPRWMEEGFISSSTPMRPQLVGVDSSTENIYLRLLIRCFLQIGTCRMYSWCKVKFYRRQFINFFFSIIYVVFGGISIISSFICLFSRYQWADLRECNHNHYSYNDCLSFLRGCASSSALL